MDWSLRMKFFPAKLLDKEISVGVIVRVGEDTRCAILKFNYQVLLFLEQHSRSYLNYINKREILRKRQYNS